MKILLLLLAIYLQQNWNSHVIEDYENTTYYKETKNNYGNTMNDKGKIGEFHVYQKLQYFEDTGAKFLFNTYLPQKNGTTTEVDVIMISGKGIFVFESKNYNGWIYGNEQNEKWCQTLPKGYKGINKQYFYNPIRQNRGHITAIKNTLERNYPIYSIIVFSDNCTLKKIEYKNNDIEVINLCDIQNTVNMIYSKTNYNIISDINIANIYEKLRPYSNVSTDVKNKHNKNVASRH